MTASKSVQVGADIIDKVERRDSSTHDQVTTNHNNFEPVFRCAPDSDN
jgi:hypothetical protein